MTKLEHEKLVASLAEKTFEPKNYHDYFRTGFKAGYHACLTSDPVVLGLRKAIEFALIYDPQTDTYKVKHTAYPKLKAALQTYDSVAGKAKS